MLPRPVKLGGARGGGCFAGVMTDIRTSRLLLHAIDVAEAERIVARKVGSADAWSADFPFEGDVGAVAGFLRATAEHGDQRPFGYRITRLADRRAVGGIGFKGQPKGDGVEIGYGLAPSARATATPLGRSSPCWPWPPTSECPR